MPTKYFQDDIKKALIAAGASEQSELDTGYLFLSQEGNAVMTATPVCSAFQHLKGTKCVLNENQ